MKPGAIEIQKLVAVVILSMGIAYSCGRARADETGSGVPASPAVVPAKAGVILVRAITRGGVRPGEVLMVTGSGGLERVGLGQVSHEQLIAARLRLFEHCINP
jgi:hypothetical protein